MRESFDSVKLCHTVVLQLLLLFQYIPHRDHPEAIADVFHAQLFRLHQTYLEGNSAAIIIMATRL